MVIDTGIAFGESAAIRGVERESNARGLGQISGQPVDLKRVHNPTCLSSQQLPFSL